MDWSIQEVAKLAGTTSRTLRHYDDIGLLAPSRVAANGYRHYDQDALVRLQRILLLRDLGLALPQIADVLTHQESEQVALEAHLGYLRAERDRISRQIDSVAATLEAQEGGERLMAHDMFDGFDHTQYREEVTARWGADAYQRGDDWWRGMNAAEKDAWKQSMTQLIDEWRSAAAAGIPADSDDAQALAERQVRWLAAGPGTPARSGTAADVKAYVLGLGDLYVADPRFAANYAIDDGDVSGAEFVRDALRVYAEAKL